MFPLDEQTEQEFFPEAPAPAGGAVWMLSFADLLSVLLTFFVMLYSTTAVQNEKWEEFLKSLKTSMHEHTDSTIQASIPEPEAGPHENAGSDLDYLATVLTDKASAFPEIAKAVPIRGKGTLTLSFPLEIFFKEDQFDTKSSAGTLSSLVNIFDLINNHIDVAVVIPKNEKTGRPDIWKDSLLKAHLVAHAMNSFGYHSSPNAYSYVSLRQRGTEAIQNTPRVDFIIREGAN